MAIQCELIKWSFYVYFIQKNALDVKFSMVSFVKVTTINIYWKKFDNK